MPEVNLSGAVLAVAVPALRFRTAVGPVTPMPTLPEVSILTDSPKLLFVIIAKSLPVPLPSLLVLNNSPRLFAVERYAVVKFGTLSEPTVPVVVRL